MKLLDLNPDYPYLRYVAFDNEFNVVSLGSTHPIWKHFHVAKGRRDAFIVPANEYGQHDVVRSLAGVAMTKPEENIDTSSNSPDRATRHVASGMASLTVVHDCLTFTLGLADEMGQGTQMATHVQPLSSTYRKNDIFLCGVIPLAYIHGLAAEGTAKSGTIDVFLSDSDTHPQGFHLYSVGQTLEAIGSLRLVSNRMLKPERYTMSLTGRVSQGRSTKFDHNQLGRWLTGAVIKHRGTPTTNNGTEAEWPIGPLNGWKLAPEPEPTDDAEDSEETATGSEEQ